jgi:hypothetical protein
MARRARSHLYSDGAMIELLEQVSAPEYEAASMTVEAARLWAGAVTIVMSIDGHQQGTEASRWSIRCDDPVEVRLDLVQPAGVLELLSEHPLLLRHNAPRSELFFSGKPESLAGVIGELVIAHEAVSQGWMAFREHLNRFLSVEALLGGGFGILAEGPEPLILAYTGVLARHRLAPAVIAARGPVRWRRGEWEELAAPYRVLMADSTYVIAARFTAKRGEP